MTLTSLLDDPGATLARIRAHVAALTPADRVAECRSIAAKHQERLWELASAAPTGVDGQLVPAGEATATFMGRNSLRAFSHFEKRFARQGADVVGRNVHPLGWLIGPGYFLVDQGVHGGRIRFDYSRVPTEVPAGWPTPSDNKSSMFARAVYGDLLDKVLWITADVLIGAAFRRGLPLGSYFVLARSAADAL
ncbi:MAG TPA: hypothetical protein VFB69_05845 [Candidatus Dormibacteraeota bacterium]|nr:hypothetical protein [Candidatus Dormibacteraeota bacterium]